MLIADCQMSNSYASVLLSPLFTLSSMIQYSLPHPHHLLASQFCNIIMNNAQYLNIKAYTNSSSIQIVSLILILILLLLISGMMNIFTYKLNSDSSSSSHHPRWWTAKLIYISSTIEAEKKSTIHSD